ncbi:hypothetical protein ACS0TY_007747 [Phlomoides rotata]
MIDEANDQRFVRTSVGSNNPGSATVSLLSECVFNSNKVPSVIPQSDFSGDDGVGQQFIGGAVEFRNELIKYVTAKGFNFKYTKNEKRYIYVVCSELQSCGCGWFIRAKCMVVNTNFVISHTNLNYTCGVELIVQPNKRFGSSVLGCIVHHNVKSDQTILTKEIVNLMKDGYGIDVSYWMAHRSIEIAREELFGNYNESYDHLRWYCEAINRKNPGSIVDLESNQKTMRFERIFIGFRACIKGFKSCRPMLFIDGTFMKGRVKGILLSATAKDGGNAFDIVFQDHVHFFCLYHLLANVKGHFSSSSTNTVRVKLVYHFKECAYAPNQQVFQEKLAKFKDVGGKMTEEWLERLPYDK